MKHSAARGPGTWRVIPLLLAFLLSSPLARAEQDVRAPELAIFVGRLAEVRELDLDCGRGCWNFDSGYRLRYSVLEALSGDAGSHQGGFDFFGHYGLPSFAHYDTALLFVFKDDKTSVMARYLAFPVTRTKDGAWAFCGDPYPEDVSRSNRPSLHRVEFEAPVAASGVTSGYRGDAWWPGWSKGMKQGQKCCRKAALAQDLAAYFQSRAEPGYNRVFLFADPEEQEPPHE